MRALFILLLLSITALAQVGYVSSPTNSPTDGYTIQRTGNKNKWVASGGSQVWTNDGLHIFKSGEPSVKTDLTSPSPRFWYTTNGSSFIGAHLSQDFNPDTQLPIRMFINETLLMTDSNDPPNIRMQWAIIDSENYGFDNSQAIEMLGSAIVDSVGQFWFSQNTSNKLVTTLIRQSVDGSNTVNAMFNVKVDNTSRLVLAPGPKGISSLSGQNVPYVFDTDAIPDSGETTLAKFGMKGAFNFTIGTNGNVSSPVYFLPTNALSSWPTAPQSRGGSAFVNSNGTVYVLTSLPATLTWAATNKIAP